MKYNDKISWGVSLETDIQNKLYVKLMVQEHKSFMRNYILGLFCTHCLDKKYIDFLKTNKKVLLEYMLENEMYEQTATLNNILDEK